jgi:hypothetical protein
LIGVLADVPLVFEGFDHIKTFRFTEVELKGNVKEKLATWVIEAPGYVFQGDVFSS